MGGTTSQKNCFIFLDGGGTALGSKRTGAAGGAGGPMGRCGTGGGGGAGVVRAGESCASSMLIGGGGVPGSGWAGDKEGDWRREGDVSRRCL